MNRQTLLRRLPFWVLLAVFYGIVPLLDLSGGGKLLQLLCYLPGLTFVAAWFYGLLNGFRWQLALGACLGAVPAVLVYYNATALYFALIYGALAALGSFLGGLWRKSNRGAAWESGARSEPTPPKSSARRTAGK